MEGGEPAKAKAGRKKFNSTCARGLHAGALGYSFASEKRKEGVYQSSVSQGELEKKRPLKSREGRNHLEEKIAS